MLTQPVRMENCDKCDVVAPSTVITGNGYFVVNGAKKGELRINFYENCGGTHR